MQIDSISKTTIPPEHDFTLPLAAWELAVFDAAATFTASGYRGRGTRVYLEFVTLPAAIAAAEADDRLVTYAVAASGRFIALDRADWPKWLARYARNSEMENTL